jgi:hypothetical protein
MRDEEQLYTIVDLLIEIAGVHGVSPAPVAPAWLLGRPAVTSLVIGARTDEQLADNRRAADLQPAGGRAGTAGRCEQPIAALSILASGRIDYRPDERGGSRAAQTLPVRVPLQRCRIGCDRAERGLNRELPQCAGTREHLRMRIADAGIGRRRQNRIVGEPPQQDMRVEGQAH